MDHVIDTSCLRKPELLTALERSGSSDRFILTDTAVLETLKNSQWELTARKSFEIIAKFPNKIWIAKAPGGLRRNELSTGQETGDVIDASLSAGFRELLAELVSGTDGPKMTHLRASIISAQVDLAQQQQNHDENLKGLKAAFDGIKNALNVNEYRKISDPAKKDLYRLFLIKTLAQAHLRKDVELEGRPDTVGDALANGRSISLRYLIGFYCLGFKWALRGGVGSFPATGATNELMDMAHAVIATYFDDILTMETSVRELRHDILQVLDSNITLDQVLPPTV